MAYPEVDEMVWISGYWWWFPRKQTTPESQFELRNNRVYLLQPDGTAVAGIFFAGVVSPD
jgi:hypothetical protein